MKYFAVDHAFEQGFKAGLRLQSELKDGHKTNVKSHANRKAQAYFNARAKD